MAPPIAVTAKGINSVINSRAITPKRIKQPIAGSIPSPQSNKYNLFRRAARFFCLCGRFFGFCTFLSRCCGCINTFTGSFVFGFRPAVFQIYINSSPVMVSFSKRYAESSCSFSISFSKIARALAWASLIISITLASILPEVVSEQQAKYRRPNMRW